ncbi:5-formyltetrahydrofolate cyclo-ligase [Paenibacillus sp. FSL R7-0331]|uniref:5-formyltetrahydrofolate cyclo-ligase n=1 Tax=Paenibacillus sp. FSL R7-0331 TaxID=1536773 RepID=UPI0005A97716|nr:5-formyltetrahydrofolate cyclo-ligase [Paenibacillus sp. FSL R7-0331]
MTVRSDRTAEWKRELRAAAAAARGKLPEDQREQLSSLVCRHAAEWMAGYGVNTLLAYVPFRSELDTRPLIGSAWAAGCTVLLPRVIQATGMMSLHPVHSWKELVPGAYGILEPAADSAVMQVPLHRPELIFAPGLAFDRRGGRLGYGGGYYDRLRASLETEASGSGRDTLWIGLSFGQQVIEEVPMDDHDACMDLLITEDGVMDFREERRHGI